MLDLAQMTVGEMLDAVGARKPAPGGGAVASVTGALGAALGEMALRYSVKKSTPDDLRVQLEQAIADLGASRARFLTLADADARAYAELNRLQRLSDDDPARRAGWGHAVEGAIAAPMKSMDESSDALDTLESVAESCSRWLLSDLAIAADLLASATRAAGWNVRVNLQLLPEDDARRADHERRIEDAVRATSGVADAINEHCRRSGSG